MDEKRRLEDAEEIRKLKAELEEKKVKKRPRLKRPEKSLEEFTRGQPKHRRMLLTSLIDKEK